MTSVAEERHKVRDASPLKSIMQELSSITNAIIQTGVEDIFGSIQSMDYETNKILEDPATEASPELKRTCPYCGKKETRTHLSCGTHGCISSGKHHSIV